MATLISGATGNFTTAGTWYLVNPNYRDSEAGSTATTTSFVSDATGLTPGAITINAIAVKIVSRVASPSGTFTVELYNLTGAASVANTTVTVNVTDIAANGGWYVFPTSGNVNLSAATAYTVRVKSSVNAEVTVYRSSTAGAWSQMFRTTTTQAPGSGDQIHIAGELTGAGTSNSYTVTMNNTATTTFGASVASGLPQGITVSKGGTLTFGNSASTNYYLKIQNLMVFYEGGTLNIGSAVTALDSTSTAVIEMASTSNVDTGLEFRPGSIRNLYGATKATSTLLTANASAGATVLTVASTTGMAAGDDIGIASTTRTAAECEKRTILTVDSATQITVTSGLTFAHSGTSPTQAEVIDLTRNIKIRGISGVLQGYVFNATTSVVNDWYAEFYQLGSNTGNKRGIDAQATTGTFIFKYNSVHDFGNTAFGIITAGSSSQTASTFVISNNVFYNIAQTGIQVAATSGTWTIDSNVILLLGSTTCFQLNDVGGTFTNNIAVGGVTGISLNETSAVIGTYSGNTTHSNSTGTTLGGLVNSTLSSITSWRNIAAGLSVGGAGSNGANTLTIDGVVLFGNGTQNLSFFSAQDILFTNLVSNGDTTFSTTNGLLSNNRSSNIVFENCSFGVASGIKTAHTTDLNVSNYATITLRNCVLASATEVSSLVTLPHSFVLSQKHDQTAGNHKFWLQYGVGSIDTAIYNTASPSLRLTPNTAGSKLESAPQGYGWTAAVASGSALTVSVWTRKSKSTDAGGANYNGNQQRLIVRKNIAAGINADTVLATASAAVGVDETLSGTTASVTDDAILEFILDCDGTAGWVNADDFATTVAVDTKGFKYFLDGVPQVVGNNGGGGVPASRIFTGF